MIRILTALAVMLSLSCGGERTEIVVGSKNFSENVLLGELIAQQIEAETPFTVLRRLNLGGTFLCHQALVSGGIDIYPEYTGTALTAILKQPVSDRRDVVLASLRKAYREQFQADWTAPFGFENTFAVLLRKQDAERDKLSTISDLSARVGGRVLGFNFEFQERQDGWPGLRSAYELEFAAPPRIMDLSLVYQALHENQIDVAIGNSTHGLIEALDLTQLADDRGYFPPYDAAPVTRLDTLEKFPGVAAALDALGGSLSAEQIRRLNLELDREQRKVEDVAAEFLSRSKR